MAKTYSDLVEKKEIATEQAVEFARKHNMKFFETSAKESTNVAETFLEMARLIKEQINDSTSLTEQTLRSKPEVQLKETKQSNGGCC